MAPTAKKGPNPTRSARTPLPAWRGSGRLRTLRIVIGPVVGCCLQHGHVAHAWSVGKHNQHASLVAGVVAHVSAAARAVHVCAESLLVLAVNEQLDGRAEDAVKHA